MKDLKFVFVAITVLVLACAVMFSGCDDSKRHKNSLDINFEFTIDDTLADGNGEEVKVIILAGQSNATGVAHSSILKQRVSEEKYAEYVNGYDNILINYLTENGINSSNGFVKTSPNNYYNCFGPELGLAEELSKIKCKFFIIKYSYGGTNLYEQWSKENESLFKGMVCFVNQSLDYLIKKNYTPTLNSFLWMQGESDAINENAKNYYTNLKKFVNDIRQEFGSIRFIDAGISDSPYWTYYKEVNQAKQKLSIELKNAYYIDTIAHALTYNLEPKENPDLAHYDSLSQIKLGKLFAECVLK